MSGNKANKKFSMLCINGVENAFHHQYVQEKLFNVLTKYISNNWRIDLMYGLENNWGIESQFGASKFTW